MEISNLPLSPSLRSKLLSAGYTNLCSLSSISPPELAQALNISNHEAAGILKVVLQRSRVDGAGESHAIINGAQTAWDILHDEQTLTHITTSCVELDTILGGGINCKEVTEIGGVPGIGKTQLGIQLAINVQIPVDYGGLGGKAIYIDTEGSFMVERVFQIAEACIQDTLDNFALRHKDFQVCEEKMQPKAFLANIFYFRICSYTEQIAVINYLDKFIAEQQNIIVGKYLYLLEWASLSLMQSASDGFAGFVKSQVKLVVIDSVTFHFRQDFEDLALRTRVLSGMALKLMKLAKKFCLAVVLLNQVTTKFIDGSFQLTLALGDSWSHACTNRIILYWNGNERNAYIDKSPSLQSASASFSVTSKGIRSVTSNSKRIKIL